MALRKILMFDTFQILIWEYTYIYIYVYILKFQKFEIMPKNFQMIYVYIWNIFYILWIIFACFKISETPVGTISAVNFNA